MAYRQSPRSANPLLHYIGCEFNDDRHAIVPLANMHLHEIFLVEDECVDLTPSSNFTVESSHAVGCAISVLFLFIICMLYWITFFSANSRSFRDKPLRPLPLPRKSSHSRRDKSTRNRRGSPTIPAAESDVTFSKSQRNFCFSFD